MSKMCNSSNTTSCSEGFFCPSNVGSDDTPCIKCKQECATCTGESAEAATCLTCADGQYLSSGTCANCDSKCATCTGSEASTCQSCANGNFLSGTTCSACVSGNSMKCTCGTSENCETCATDKTKCDTCIGEYDISATIPCSACKAGYFESSDIPKTCSKCPENCATCTAETTCKTCKDGNILTANLCVPCTKNQMTACTCKSTKNCQTCEASDKSKCATCINNFDPSESTPCQNCLPGFVKEVISGSDTCTACSANCATCTSGSVCTLCKNGFLLKGNECTACSTIQTTACTCQAAKNCSICDISMIKCAACINNYELTGTTPCEKCRPRFFEDITAIPNKCTACSNNCTTCTSASVCTACEEGFLIENNTCVACTDENCKTCQASKDTCTACKNDFTVQNGKCEKQCATAAQCRSNQICDSICKTCTGNCAVCKDDIANCRVCQPGFLLTGNTCRQCPTGCANCAGDTSVCQICLNNFYFKKDKCFICTGNLKEPCQCHRAINCGSCDLENLSRCATCISGYAIDKNGECSICAQGFLMLGGVCAKCDSRCGTCSQNAKTCDSCAKGYTMNVHQTCEEVCADMLTDGHACIGGKAVQCGSRGQVTECKCGDSINCRICSADGSNKCGGCLYGYKIEDGACANCVDGAVAVGAFCFASAEESNRLSSGAVAGISLAVIAVVLGASGGVFWYLRRAKIAKRKTVMKWRQQ
ncbi:Cysteine-rich membrane protein 2 [Spironucleus salmonicida]|uniref:Cysteine-rich membrane protein 2 n=3 Tax=Spironucleus salmonicida TaxID=348837 RepID=A0A9P8LXS3_9EUKA|nr:Cysteine-rich membrane protein 2 [Spironucleus salmonicida]